MPRKFIAAVLGLMLIAAVGALAAGAQRHAPAQTAIGAPLPADSYVKARNARDAGEYLLVVGGCNDCHTPGWSKSEGSMPRTEWLTGNPKGFTGPWGTSYAINLRLAVRSMSRAEFIESVRTTRAKPPMPWFNISRLSDRDLSAAYQFLYDLGAKGEATPADVPPAQTPEAPPSPK
jgi:hypothetical protein